MKTRLAPSLFLALLFTTNIAHAFVAHEWGTFTSLVGSNGKTQEGMYHEDEALPDFVHKFGETQTASSIGIKCRQGKGCIADSFLSNNLITQKMETPVIYFYSDKTQSVDVNVKFPNGVITETFPAPIATFPKANDKPIIANGDTTFRVEILNKLTGDLPHVDKHNIYGHARNVKSNMVKSAREQEKFIFYRGLGTFSPNLDIASRDGNLTLAARNEIPQAAFLVHVDDNHHAQAINLGAINNLAIDAQTLTALADHHHHDICSSILSTEQTRDAMINSLVDAGLFHDEAVAMLDTWQAGYLTVPGLRLLYVVPSREVDEILPLTIQPAPEKLVRAFVARVEILLDTKEQVVLRDIVRMKDAYDPSVLGRFSHSILHRIAEIYDGSDVSVTELIKKFLLHAKNN